MTTPMKVLSDEEVKREAGLWVTNKVLMRSSCVRLPNSEKKFDEKENYNEMEKQDDAFKQTFRDFDSDY